MKIQRHEKLGDDIPDFTGVKVCDGNRDIFEIKQPFIRIFRKDKKFASDFNEAWNQIEKYVRFAKESKDYLFREKGLKFENPRGFLIVGHNLNDEYRKRLKNKEKMIAEIEILTYNDLLSFAKSTIEFLKNLKKENEKKE